VRFASRLCAGSEITRRALGQVALAAWLGASTRQETWSAFPGAPELDDIARWRADFATLDQTVNGQPLAYLDSAATTQRQPFPKEGWRFPPRWAPRPRSTSSPPGVARRRSQGTSSSWSEVNPILKTLRQHGIEVTALHSHMIDDAPHLFFMHFWANDDAQRLARVLRAALDLANVKRGS
jgi:Domain of Unknown Function (DUF1259)